ncbi:MAG: dissimilatory-type sulfite reductase subunit alpha [Proteobacteria bacterium]|nr:dissimilatory-type sulfite reductase subunit alpha [Pseudomonadota bacterium]
MAKHETPLLDQLESGPWPSFVSDIKQEAATRAKNAKGLDYQMPSDVCDDLLGILELSYKDGTTHWKHGGIVGVFGYGGGIIGRYCDKPKDFPGVAAFHTVRVAQPGGKYYTTAFLNQLMDIWDLRGSGLTNMHGSTGDIILLGTTTPQLEEIFYQLTHEMGQDLGGSGSNLRTPADCIGSSRCEYACFDTQELCYFLTMTYQDELHRPAFPYKFKFKFDGCPNGCVCSIARSDLSFIGTWKDQIQVNQAEVKAYIDGKTVDNGGAFKGRDWGKFDIQKEVIDLCPTGCMALVKGELKINDKECTRCMHCINVMPKALKPGKDKGVSILCGAKAPIVDGAQMGTLIRPFISIDQTLNKQLSDFEDEDEWMEYLAEKYEAITEFIELVWDYWMEEGKNRERLGELMMRQGLQKFLEKVEVEPMAVHVQHPRTNPYIFWKEDEVEGGWGRDIEDYRKAHSR